eukprot:scaffold758_cov104-Cylindrotheca_fusiformis.AAC.7
MDDALHKGEATSVLFWQFMPQNGPPTVNSLIRARGQCQAVRFLPKNSNPLMYNGNEKELFATTLGSIAVCSCI